MASSSDSKPARRTTPSVRERFDSEQHLAAVAGVTPLTYASGKSKSVAFRWACNHKLRKAITCLADNSRHASAWAADVYARAKARGCDHPHATADSTPYRHEHYPYLSDGRACGST